MRSHNGKGSGALKAIALCTVALIFLAAPCLAGASTGTELRTEHFILYLEGLDPADTGRLLEAGYAHMKAFFNAEPDRKMQVKVFATRERYQAAFDNLRKIFYWNKKHRSNMGLYARETATSYIWVQPDEYLTRRLLLHELAHQFHDLTRPWSYVPSLDYCDEGLAEHFSWHNWDGEVLEIGTMPQLSPFDYPGRALHQLRAPTGYTFENVVHGDEEIDYALAWGMVSFLIKEHPKKFHVWRTALNHEVEPRIAWEKQFGAVTPAFVDSFEAWLKKNLQPWQVVAGFWQPWGLHVEGQPNEYRSAQAVLVKVPARFTADFGADEDKVAGVTFGFQGGRNFFVLERHHDRWEIANLLGSESHRTKRQTFPASSPAAAATIETKKDGTLLTFGEHRIEMTNVTGRVGLWVARGKTRFRCSWE